MNQPDSRSVSGAHADTERRRRRAEIFGDLPESTADDRPEAWGDRDQGGDDDRLRREVPPHHG